MQKFYNDSDNKLRQLENQSLPDLSKQEEHWQGMKTMLTPGIVISKPASKIKLWQWVVAACIIGGLCFMIYDRVSDSFPLKTKKDIAGIKDTAKVEIKIVPGKTSSPVVVEEKISAQTMIGKTVKTKLSKKVPVKNIIENKSWIIPIISPDTVVKTTTDPAEAKAILAGFFNQMEKPSQQFVIDNKRDTVIWGKDGSALLVPANTFYTNEKVTITMKEYYTYEDIITNKLSTSSDGAQLVTGGMIHIEATSNNRKVSILPGKSIRWFIRDTTADMEDMQVFIGHEENNTNSPHNGATAAASNSSINWRPSSTNFSKNFITTQLKVLDLRDYPFKTTSYKKYKGFFFLNTGAGLSKDELKGMLKEKYPYYDKVIVAGKRKKKEWKRNQEIIYTGDPDDILYSIGDTTWVYPVEAKIYKLKVLDTLTYTNRSSVQKSPPDLNMQLKRVTGKYSVDITTLGWINCDKFLRNYGTKIDYIVNIGEPSSDYYTVLVFDRLKSMMSGLTAGNKVLFQGVPEGETAKVICVGVKDGKPVAAMEKVTISRSPLTGLKFEETSPSEFKERAGTMDK